MKPQNIKRLNIPNIIKINTNDLLKNKTVKSISILKNIIFISTTDKKLIEIHVNKKASHWVHELKVSNISTCDESILAKTDRYVIRPHSITYVIDLYTMKTKTQKLEKTILCCTENCEVYATDDGFVRFLNHPLCKNGLCVKIVCQNVNNIIERMLCSTNYTQNSNIEERINSIGLDIKKNLLFVGGHYGKYWVYKLKFISPDKQNLKLIYTYSKQGSLDVTGSVYFLCSHNSGCFYFRDSRKIYIFRNRRVEVEVDICSLYKTKTLSNCFAIPCNKNILLIATTKRLFLYNLLIRERQMSLDNYYIDNSIEEIIALKRIQNSVCRSIFVVTKSRCNKRRRVKNDENRLSKKIKTT